MTVQSCPCHNLKVCSFLHCMKQSSRPQMVSWCIYQCNYFSEHQKTTVNPIIRLFRFRRCTSSIASWLFTQSLSTICLKVETWKPCFQRILVVTQTRIVRRLGLYMRKLTHTYWFDSMWRLNSVILHKNKHSIEAKQHKEGIRHILLFNYWTASTAFRLLSQGITSQGMSHILNS